MLLRSSALGAVAHGFPLRAGGVSTGRYASLNLLYKWGDERAHVDENRRRLAEAGGFSTERLYTVRQVHGAEVVTVGADPPSSTAERAADAMVSDRAGVALGIGTADCVPILFSDGRRAGAAHAGWRGTIAGVAAATIEALVALGAARSALRVALGPCICVRCFEVGPEVADAFAALPGVVDRSNPKAHVDLRRANRVLLERAGVRPEAIDDAPPCTMCDPERFFSYRRDGAGIGQHLSFVVVGGA
jgi:YfiH family protein